MPNVTRRPASAAGIAATMAARNAASSPMTWSDGRITSTGSLPSAIACSAATAIAGAVLRPIGSRISAAGLMPICCSCSATKNRCSSFATTIGALAPGMSADVVMFDMGQIGYAGALHDPVAALVFCTPTTVSVSVINGRVVVREGQCTTVDLGVVVERHNRLAAELVG